MSPVKFATIDLALENAFDLLKWYLIVLFRFMLSKENETEEKKTFHL